MKYHMTAFFLGFLLDGLLGDPYCFPHPVRWIGSLIAGLEKWLRRKITGTDSGRERRYGRILVILVLGITFVVSAVVLLAAYRLNLYVGVLTETVMTYWLLAAKCLKTESMKVYERLKNQDEEGARKAVSMIVGRDTQNLKQEEIVKAAVETVAENTSDGIIAPMLYTAFLGPVFGFLYKAVNTMDSMLGYKNERYLYFGRTAAKLDDAANFIPSRISAYLMLAAVFLSGRDFSPKNAWRIYRRDRKKHASPNSAQTESVCAGALGIKLAGNASYFGRLVEKPCIGDALRPAEYEDIKKANRLMYRTAWLGELLCLAGMAFCLS